MMKITFTTNNTTATTNNTEFNTLSRGMAILPAGVF